MPSLRDKYPHLEFEDRAGWRGWLEEHHATAKGVWLILPKASSGRPGMPYEEAIEEALCFGWIDSTANAYDAERTLLLFTPRKKGSGWSRSNKERIERLTAAGRMTPAGQAKIDAAMQDGSWTLLDPVEAMIVPDDLAAALASDSEAERNFAAFSASARKQMLHWVYTAKRPETRKKRIAGIVKAARENHNPLQWRPKQDAS
jgi:uncharacterized protein YdeI (YjbR/CyaY-like superfamily)